jgi:hypothetical protein
VVALVLAPPSALVARSDPLLIALLIARPP